VTYRQSVYIEAVDTNGSTAQQSLHTAANPPPSFGPVDDVLATMEACMAGTIRAAWLAPVSVYTGDPGPGPYSTVFDKAAFTWRSEAGLIVRTTIPAPGDIFDASTRYVDLTNPAVLAYIAACQAALADSGGSPLLVVTSAVRTRYTPGGL
jgi:hypothetical protein